MRGAFILVIVIALLIVGILTVKNMKTETPEGVTREEAVEKAHEAAKQAEDAMDRIKKANKQVEVPSLK